MTSVPVQAVIFDMDDVLCRYDRKVRMEALVQLTGLDAETITAGIFSSGLEDDHDAGRIDDVAYLAQLTECLGPAITETTWLDTRKQSITPTPQVLALATGLKGRVPLALLTNNGTFYGNRVAQLFPELPEIFDPHTYFSGALKCAKPNPNVFLEVCRRLGSKPEATLFIDDNEGFIAGAVEAGLQTHLFVGIEGLAARLADI